MSPLKRFIPTLIILITSGPIAAGTGVERYVAEDHAVELMTGFSSQDHALATLAPGETVQLLKLNEKEGEARIQRESGEVGWVKSNDLKEKLPAMETVAPANEIANPKTTEQLQQELGQLQGELIQMRASSADILRTQAERDQLQSTVINLKREIETLRQEKNALDEDQKQTWLMIGAIVLVGGIFLGILLPRISIRKRNQWGSF